MAGEPRTGGTERLLTGAVWVVLLFALGLWGAELTDGEAPRPGPVPGETVADPAEAADGRVLPAARTPLPAAAPRRVGIDAIGVHARVVERGLNRDGAVQPPPMGTPGDVGWYRDGPAPGTPGAALLVGHLDTDTGRAVFHRLSSVRPGAQVDVARTDGTVAEFTVEEVTVAEHADFDPREVYGTRRPGRAELRLITCTGPFDRAGGSYTANLVVSAYLTGVRPGSGAGPSPG
ncbi:MAG TPA: class F sortase [Streptomyces sp.]|nr:class F sortase [Streptomyces sp.]